VRPEPPPKKKTAPAPTPPTPSSRHRLRPSFSFPKPPTPTNQNYLNLPDQSRAEPVLRCGFLLSALSSASPSPPTDLHLSRARSHGGAGRRVLRRRLRGPPAVRPDRAGGLRGGLRRRSGVLLHPVPRPPLARLRRGRRGVRRDLRTVRLRGAGGVGRGDRVVERDLEVRTLSPQSDSIFYPSLCSFCVIRGPHFTGPF
jgi:hypothetical protein